MRIFIKYCTCLLATLACSELTMGQSLYVPRNFKQALKKETRTLTGMPGKNYWQNTATYVITITALPPDRTITGSEQIAYTNNSPDTLKTILVKLFMNYHEAWCGKGWSCERTLPDLWHTYRFYGDQWAHSKGARPAQAFDAGNGKAAYTPAYPPNR